MWWHFLATTSLVIAVLAKAPTHQSGKFVFRTFVDDTGLEGVGWSQRASTAYVGVIGSLFAQYGLTGRSTRRIARMDIHFLIDCLFRFRRGCLYDGRDSKRGHGCTDWHHPIYRRLRGPRLLPHTGFALLNSRLHKDHCVANGPTSNADILGHGRRERRDRSDGGWHPVKG